MKQLLTGLLLFWSGSYILAQNSEQGAGFAMLDIAPTPFALSRAEATTSFSEGSASVYSNPALLAYNTTSSVDLGYSFWIANVNNIFGGVNLRNGRQALAFAFYSSGSDDYEQYNTPGDPNGTFSVQNLSIAGAYAYDLNYFSIGLSLQYLNEQIFTYTANGYAVNGGIAARFLENRLRLGASVVNLGEMDKLNVQATNLPANLKFGISGDVIRFMAPKNEDLPILVSVYVDYIHPLENSGSKDFADYIVDEDYLNLGVSFDIADVLEISSGYKTRNDVRPVSFGAAFYTEEITFNYALIPFKTGFGTVHSIGLQYKF